MKYIKYLIAYISLLGMVSVVILLILSFFDKIELSIGDRTFLIVIVFFAFSTIYDKFKPFALTGDLNNRIKEKWNSYLTSQVNCPNCNKIMNRNEITNGKCPYCKAEFLKKKE